MEINFNGVELLLIAGAGIVVAAVMLRRGFQPGIVIVVIAAAASFLPGVPRLELGSELVLAVVVPPLLYSAARRASVTSFGTNLRPILSLGVGLVVLTTGALGLVTSWLLPSLGLATAFMVGAVLAPPDTITTVSHGASIGPPRRVTAILTGESLVNDATALTLFSIAVAATDGEEASIGSGPAEFAYTAAAGAAIGMVLSVAVLLVRRRLHEPALETSPVLLLPFTAFLLAEQVHASGILAVVVASFLVSVNLTLKFVLDDLSTVDEPGLGRVLLAAVVLLAAAVALQILGVYGLFGRWALSLWIANRMLTRNPDRGARRQEQWERRRKRSGRVPLGPPTAKEDLLVGWTGMRGIVTLAAAASVPESVPGRDAIQAIASIVTVGTLLLQSPTLRPLARALKFDTAAEREAVRVMRERGAGVIGAAAGPGRADGHGLRRSADRPGRGGGHRRPGRGDGPGPDRPGRPPPGREPADRGRLNGAVLP